MGAKPTWRGAESIVGSGWVGFGEIGGNDGGVEM